MAASTRSPTRFRGQTTIFRQGESSGQFHEPARSEALRDLLVAWTKQHPLSPPMRPEMCGKIVRPNEQPIIAVVKQTESRSSYVPSEADANLQPTEIFWLPDQGSNLGPAD